jgi:NADH:ubiquinone oxidoreductase subunit K
MELSDVQINMLASFILLFLGLYCVISKKNMIKMIIGIEIMAKGALLSFIASGGGSIQSVIIIVIAIDAIIVAVALSIVVNAWRHTRSLDVTKLTKLRG